MSGDDSEDSNDSGNLRPVRDAHKALGLWSIRRALTFAFSGAAVLLVAAWFLVSWLLGSPPRDQPKPLDTAAQLELLKLVFALVAGVGALVALVTAYRRQRVDEAAGELAQRIARDTAHDATERRVTEMYGQAVEQLGHDKAAVRLGGLYSLERLAQDHPQHRQTVTDVVCAYLRMPFQPPPPATTLHQPPETDTADPAPADHDEARQELQVRLAAQRLLHRHLTTTPPTEHQPATYWDGILIDLTDAYLISFDFTRCRPHHATFTNTHFSGDAEFDGAQFSGNARFDGAQFSGNAWFDGTRFNGSTWFNRAQFSGNVRFRRAQFSGPAWFRRTQFSASAVFDGAQFSGNARFDGAQFNGPAWFDGAQFGGDARFDGTEFSEDTRFRRTRFNGPAWFDRAQFGGNARFDGAEFSGNARFRKAQFGGNAWFRKAQFSGIVGFSRAQFGGNARFSEARFTREPGFEGATVSHPNDNHAWPPPWRAQAQSSEAGTAQLIREP